jgi:RNA polymerase sigma-70 factor, ECF subfamily
MIARRRIVDRLRANSRQPDFQKLTDFSEKQTVSTETELQTKIQAKRVFREVQNLRAEQRDLIFLSTFEGMSHSEISKKTGIPLGTVKTNIRRGINALREVFGQKSSVTNKISFN